MPSALTNSKVQMSTAAVSLRTTRTLKVDEFIVLVSRVQVFQCDAIHARRSGSGSAKNIDQFTNVRHHFQFVDETRRNFSIRSEDWFCPLQERRSDRAVIWKQNVFVASVP